jgi:hypothetical protein
MKNRKMLYILVPAVILIWGAVAYSIFNHMHSSDSNFEQQNAPVSFKTTDTDSIKYQLLANYRDPFNAGIRNTKYDEIGEQEKMSRSQNIGQPVAWPQIEYQGLISHNKKWVALIKINNSNLLMKEGDEKMDIKLIKMYNDSVLLKFQKNNKVFAKSNTK